MAAQSEGGGKDDVKTQFCTREGSYKLMSLSEYSRPNRVGLNGQGNAPVKVSFIKLDDQPGTGDRICFNIGRELYFYMYKGVRKAADLTMPIDKRVYKGTFPTCHDFNQVTASSDSVMLLVGFTAGQVQLIDPIKKELSKLYNEERLIDKTKVTCIKWIPHSQNQFLVSHASGQMYVYNEEHPCGATAPHYQTFKHGEGFSVFTCKTKSTRNPLYRWMVGEGPINEFAFSPCSRYLAVAGQDGYMRVFNFDSMEIIGFMKTYFGGLLCVCWSPDGKYIVAGGEDDLVTVWSFHEKRVVCRGQGHRSWVNVVSFDPYTTSFGDDNSDYCGSDEDFAHTHSNHCSQEDNFHVSNQSNLAKTIFHSGSNSDKSHVVTSYRFGSVGQDTLICLWDLTEDILKQTLSRNKTSTVGTQLSSGGIGQANFVNANDSKNDVGSHHNTSVTTSLTYKFATLALGEKKDKEEKKDHKRNFSLAGRSTESKVNLLKSGDKSYLLKTNHIKHVDDSLRLMGTAPCPKITDVPLLEPLVSKKIAQERLTALIFRDDCFVSSCQEGYICTWARPGHVMNHSKAVD